MIALGVIGPAQLIFISIFLFIPIIVFFIGYKIGQKSGYIKRVKEEENKR